MTYLYGSQVWTFPGQVQPGFSSAPRQYVPCPRGHPSSRRTVPRPPLDWDVDREVECQHTGPTSARLIVHSGNRSEPESGEEEDRLCPPGNMTLCSSINKDISRAGVDKAVTSYFTLLLRYCLSL